HKVSTRQYSNRYHGLPTCPIASRGLKNVQPIRKPVQFSLFLYELDRNGRRVDGYCVCSWSSVMKCRQAEKSEMSTDIKENRARSDRLNKRVKLGYLIGVIDLSSVSKSIGRGMTDQRPTRADLNYLRSAGAILG